MTLPLKYIIFYNRIRLDSPLHVSDFLLGSNTRHNLIISKCLPHDLLLLLSLSSSLALNRTCLQCAALSISLSLGLSSCDDSSVAAEISLLLDVFCFISRSANVSGQQQFTLNRKKQLFLGCEKVSKFCSGYTNAYVYIFIR